MSPSGMLLLVAVVGCFGALRLTSNPTICDSTVKQYAGYFDIDNKTNKHYFYWAFESRGAPSTDPIVLWMTGGPGCSSETALFGENGPCTVDKSGQTHNNPYSWNTKATTIYIDQPAGVGFSYSDASGHDHNEKEVADDMYQFLQEFFAAHPSWQANGFFVFAESYGGHYAPAVAHRVWQGNQNKEGIHINLKGLGVGNGLTDPEIQYQYYPDLAYNYSKTRVGHPIVTLEQYKQMEAGWPRCHSMIAACQTSGGMACTSAQSYCNNLMIGPYQETGMNPYDIREKCQVPPLCYDFSAVTDYLNEKSVQAALGVDQKWATCNFEVNGQFSADWMKNYQQDVPDLLTSGIPVLIYAGDVDFICNWIGNKAWTLALPWSGKSAFNAAQDKPWTVDGQTAGVIRSAQGFTFLQVHNAGHMVPRDQPKNSLVMLNNFLAGQL